MEELKKTSVEMCEKIKTEPESVSSNLERTYLSIHITG